jgi:hypothetical protein
MRLTRKAESVTVGVTMNATTGQGRVPLAAEGCPRVTTFSVQPSALGAFGRALGE